MKPSGREHRRKRLRQEQDQRMAALADMEASVPALNALMLLRIGRVTLPEG
jgi:alpha-D-ribose 1-methylphosphonate 5-triphosphate synthase subunit PhnI